MLMTVGLGANIGNVLTVGKRKKAKQKRGSSGRESSEVLQKERKEHGCLREIESMDGLKNSLG
jgi:hypothetical protein